MLPPHHLRWRLTVARRLIIPPHHSPLVIEGCSCSGGSLRSPFSLCSGSHAANKHENEYRRNNDTIHSYTCSLSLFFFFFAKRENKVECILQNKTPVWLTGPHRELKGTFLHWQQMGTCVRHATEHTEPLINFQISREHQHPNGDQTRPFHRTHAVALKLGEKKGSTLCDWAVVLVQVRSYRLQCTKTL